MKKQAALLIIDMQKDFCAGGSLAVPGADELVPKINLLQLLFTEIIASYDWHPPGHISFASTHHQTVGKTIIINDSPQILWPDHCVQFTAGAELHPHIAQQYITKVIYKGNSIDVDSYSAFFNNARNNSTDLAAYLHTKQITELYITGVATEFCVNYSCLDAVASGFTVNLITDACAGIDEHNINKTLAALSSKGVKLITTTALFSTIAKH